MNISEYKEELSSRLESDRDKKELLAGFSILENNKKFNESHFRYVLKRFKDDLKLPKKDLDAIVAYFWSNDVKRANDSLNKEKS